MRVFYQKIITIEPLMSELNSLDLDEEHKTHLAALIDSSIHHTIMDEILSNLNEEDKELFLQKVENGEDEEIMKFLNSKIENIEKRIQDVSDGLIKELHEDVKEVKKR